MNRVAILDFCSHTARLVLLGYEPERRYRLELCEVVRLSESKRALSGRPRSGAA